MTAEDPDGAVNEAADLDTVETRTSTEGSLPPPVEPSGVPLAEGLALTVDEANELAADAGATLVMPLGPVGVGKTTLTVEIYARFLAHTTWASCSFCWSETLLDYELLAFPSRLQSGATLPATWRTRLQDNERHLLHLRLRQADPPGTRSDLLFANLSGELSDRIRDGGDPNEELPLLPHSQRILICVDGALVASQALCGRAVSGTRQMLGTLAERGVFAPEARAALVLTKWDKVVAAGGEGRWGEAEQALAKKMAALERGVETFRVAARPEGIAPVDDGMENLMRWLIDDRSERSTQGAVPPAPSRAMGHYEGPEA